jgi:hypothetical protein
VIDNLLILDVVVIKFIITKNNKIIYSIRNGVGKWKFNFILFIFISFWLGHLY